jgi:hypothetical protein
MPWDGFDLSSKDPEVKSTAIFVILALAGLSSWFLRKEVRQSNITYGAVALSYAAYLAMKHNADMTLWELYLLVFVVFYGVVRLSVGK